MLSICQNVRCAWAPGVQLVASHRVTYWDAQLQQWQDGGITMQKPNRAYFVHHLICSHCGRYKVGYLYNAVRDTYN